MKDTRGRRIAVTEKSGDARRQRSKDRNGRADARKGENVVEDVVKYKSAVEESLQRFRKAAEIFVNTGSKQVRGTAGKRRQRDGERTGDRERAREGVAGKARFDRATTSHAEIEKEQRKRAISERTNEILLRAERTKEAAIRTMSSSFRRSQSPPASSSLRESDWVGAESPVLLDSVLLHSPLSAKRDGAEVAPLRTRSPGDKEDDGVGGGSDSVKAMGERKWLASSRGRERERETYLDGGRSCLRGTQQIPSKQSADDDSEFGADQVYPRRGGRIADAVSNAAWMGKAPEDNEDSLAEMQGPNSFSESPIDRRTRGGGRNIRGTHVPDRARGESAHRKYRHEQDDDRKDQLHQGASRFVHDGVVRKEDMQNSLGLTADLEIETRGNEESAKLNIEAQMQLRLVDEMLARTPLTKMSNELDACGSDHGEETEEESVASDDLMDDFNYVNDVVKRSRDEATVRKLEESLNHHHRQLAQTEIFKASSVNPGEATKAVHEARPPSMAEKRSTSLNAQMHLQHQDRLVRQCQEHCAMAVSAAASAKKAALECRQLFQLRKDQRTSESAGTMGILPTLEEACERVQQYALESQWYADAAVKAAGMFKSNFCLLESTVATDAAQAAKENCNSKSGAASSGTPLVNFASAQALSAVEGDLASTAGRSGYATVTKHNSAPSVDKRADEDEGGNLISASEEENVDEIEAETKGSRSIHAEVYGRLAVKAEIEEQDRKGEVRHREIDSQDSLDTSLADENGSGVMDTRCKKVGMFEKKRSPSHRPTGENRGDSLSLHLQAGLESEHTRTDEATDRMLGETDIAAKVVLQNRMVGSREEEDGSRKGAGSAGLRNSDVDVATEVWKGLVKEGFDNAKENGDDFEDRDAVSDLDKNPWADEEAGIILKSLAAQKEAERVIAKYRKAVTISSSPEKVREKDSAQVSSLRCNPEHRSFNSPLSAGSKLAAERINAMQASTGELRTFFCGDEERDDNTPAKYARVGRLSPSSKPSNGGVVTDAKDTLEVKDGSEGHNTKASLSSEGNYAIERRSDKMKKQDSDGKMTHGHAALRSEILATLGRSDFRSDPEGCYGRDPLGALLEARQSRQRKIHEIKDILLHIKTAPVFQDPNT